VVELLGRGISPREGLCLHRNTNTNIHSVSGIRTHDLSDQEIKALDRAATGTGHGEKVFFKTQTRKECVIKVKVKSLERN
jgi:hypothetical protein